MRYNHSLSMNKRLIGKTRVLFVLAVLVLASLPMYAQTYTKSLADGVVLKQQIQGQNNNAKPMVVNIVEVDPKAPGIAVKAVVAGDQVITSNSSKGRETVSSIAKRLGAVAAVNADFFPFTGDMLNIHITDGELVSDPMPKRSVFGITSDGKYLFDTLGFDGKLILQDGRFIVINGLNRTRGKNEVIAFTPRFAPTTMTSQPGTEVSIRIDGKVQAGSAINGVVEQVSTSAIDTPISSGHVVISASGVSSIPLQNWLHPGDAVTLKFDIIPSQTLGWENVIEAVGGGPRLIRDSRISVEYDHEQFGSEFSQTLHPRTAVGVTSSGKIILITVDGRQTISSGIGLRDLADIMLQYGCVNAMNLDGGGSTTLACKYGILNSPSEGIERPVSNAIAVMAVQTTNGDLGGMSVTPINSPVKSGSSYQFGLLDSTGSPVSQSVLDQVIWTTTGGIGFVDQAGKFYGIKAGKGNVNAALGSSLLSMPVEVIPAELTKFTAKIVSDPTGAPNRSVVRITATDANLNAVPNVTVKIKVYGGTPDQETIVTGEKSGTEVGITWDDGNSKSAYVMVSANGFTAQRLNRPSK